jgi:hypothetical protein
MVKFTAEMKKASSQIRPPYKGLVVDFVEFPDYIGLRIYENQIMSMDEAKQYSVMEYLHLLRNTIKSFGVECSFDGAKGDPPRRV